MAVRLARIGVSAFDLPLSRPLRVGAESLRRRRGLLVIAADGDGRAGVGEAAPLPGLHRESLEEASAQLLELAPRLEGAAVPEACAALEGAFEAWLGPLRLLPTVRTGVEGAVLALLADRAGLPVARLLAAGAAAAVRVNGLVVGDPDSAIGQAARLAAEGFGTLKVKVGRGAPRAEADLVAAIRERVGPGVALRLDANRAWDLPTALAFAERVAPARPAYIEEPLADLLNLPLFVHHARVGVALDETLLAFAPATPPPLHGIAALIVKPSVLGGYESAAAWVRFARRERLEAVVSAAFPSAAGLALDAALAAALAPEGVHGLGTASALAQDVGRVPVVRGQIDAAGLPRRPEDFALERTRVLR